MHRSETLAVHKISGETIIQKWPTTITLTQPTLRAKWRADPRHQPYTISYSHLWTCRPRNEAGWSDCWNVEDSIISLFPDWPCSKKQKAIKTFSYPSLHRELTQKPRIIEAEIEPRSSIKADPTDDLIPKDTHHTTSQQEVISIFLSRIAEGAMGIVGKFMSSPVCQPSKYASKASHIYRSCSSKAPRPSRYDKSLWNL